MKILKQIKSLNFIIYSSIFLVTQVTGLLLSLVVCFILQDFIWGFVRIALINSFILGLSLIGACYLSQRLMFRFKIVYIILISFSLILGTSIISFFIILILLPESTSVSWVCTRMRDSYLSNLYSFYIKYFIFF